MALGHGFGEAAPQGPSAQPRDLSSSLSISPATEAPRLSASRWDGTMLIPRQRVRDQKQLWDVLSAAWAVCGRAGPNPARSRLEAVPEAASSISGKPQGPVGAFWRQAEPPQPFQSLKANEEQQQAYFPALLIKKHPKRRERSIQIRSGDRSCPPAPGGSAR